MVYRKLAADQLFTGREILGREWVLVCDEKGTVTDIIREQEAGEDIIRYPGMLSPGFINCHCHLELSHMKGKIAKGTGMVGFLLSVMDDRSASDEEILQAMQYGEEEMKRNGIVAVGDICNTVFSIPVKQSSSLRYHNFIEATGFIDASAQTRFDTSLNIYKQFKQTGAPVSVVPHAPYSVSPALFTLINDFNADSLLTIHNQESEDEELFFRKGEGNFSNLFARLGINIDHFKGTNSSSLQAFLQYISADRSLILVHNVFTTEEDIRLAINHIKQLYWCLCPNANMYINGTLPPVKQLIQSGAKIVLGTDSLASNDELSIWSEINILQKHFPFLSMTELLQWATLNGAEALNISEEFGSFDKGKTPGVIHINQEKITRII